MRRKGCRLDFSGVSGTLSQTITGLVPGVPYVITFAAANRGGSYPTSRLGMCGLTV